MDVTDEEENYTSCSDSTSLKDAMFQAFAEQQVVLAVLRSQSPVAHAFEGYHRFVHKFLPRIATEFPEKDWHTGRFRHVLKLGEVRFGLPTHKELDGTTRPIYASEARLRALDYNIEVVAEIHHKQYVRVKEATPDAPCRWRLVQHESTCMKIGDSPAQVGGTGCRTKLSGMMVNEGDNDPGGYFLHEGREKCFETNLRFRNNFARVYFHPEVTAEPFTFLPGGGESPFTGGGASSSGTNSSGATTTSSKSTLSGRGTLINCEYRCDIEHLQKVGCSTHLYLSVPDRQLYIKHYTNKSTNFESLFGHSDDTASSSLTPGSEQSLLTEGRIGLQGHLPPWLVSPHTSSRVKRAETLFNFSYARNNKPVEHENVTVFMPNVPAFNIPLHVFFFILGVRSKRHMLNLICPWTAASPHNGDFNDDDVSEKCVTEIVKRILDYDAGGNNEEEVNDDRHSSSMHQSNFNNLRAIAKLGLPPVVNSAKMKADWETVKRHVDECFPVLVSPMDNVNHQVAQCRLEGFTRSEIIAHFVCALIPKVHVPAYDDKSGNAKPLWHYAFERFKKSAVEELVPNAGMDYTWLSTIAKQNLLASSVRKMVLVYIRKLEPDDVDHMNSRRLQTIPYAKIYKQHFMVAFKRFRDMITARSESDKPKDANRELSLYALAEKYIPSDPFRTIVGSGAWTSTSGIKEFVGATCEVEHTSPIAILEEMRKVKTPLQAQSDVSRAHQLHPSKARILCAKHTPSTKDAGLKTYMAKSVRVRQGYELEELLVLVLAAKESNGIISQHDYAVMKDLDPETFAPMAANLVEVQINGTTIGFTMDPRRTLEVLRMHRRRGYLPDDVGITWVGGPLYQNGPLKHPLYNYINILGDAFGAVRPVIDATQLWKLERLIATEGDDSVSLWRAMTDEGVVTYVDVEEIEQLQIASSIQEMLQEDECYEAYLLSPDNPRRAELLSALMKTRASYSVPENSEYCYRDHVRFSHRIPFMTRHGHVAKAPYAYCEISDTFLYGYTASTLSFLSNTNAARNLFGSGMVNQAAVTRPMNDMYSRKSPVLSLVRPVKLLTPTVVDKVFQGGCMTNHTGQQEKLTAIASHRFNAEDGTVHIRPDFGQGYIVQKTIFVMSVRTASEKRKDATKFEKPGLDCVGLKTKDYSALKDDGMPMVGSEIQPGAAIIGATLKKKEAATVASTAKLGRRKRNIVLVTNVANEDDINGEDEAEISDEDGDDDDGNETLKYSRQDRSIINATKHPQVVKQVIQTTNDKGEQVIYVSCETLRVPDRANKGTTGGQKGVSGAVYAPEDMLYFIDYDGDTGGVMIQMIRNPHSIPSRTTMGEERHSLQAERVLKVTGVPEIVSDQHSLRIIDLQMELVKNGFDHRMKQFLYNGETGKRTKEAIYTAYFDYSYLEHFAMEKYKSRATGAIDPKTKQPNAGGNRGGGNRTGPMECTNINGQGAIHIGNQLLFHSSDPAIIRACNVCGLQATVNRLNQGFCGVCNSWESVETVKLPFATIHTKQECYAEGVALRMSLSSSKMDARGRRLDGGVHVSPTMNGGNSAIGKGGIGAVHPLDQYLLSVARKMDDGNDNDFNPFMTLTDEQITSFEQIPPPSSPVYIPQSPEYIPQSPEYAPKSPEYRPTFEDDDGMDE